MCEPAVQKLAKGEPGDLSTLNPYLVCVDGFGGDGTLKYKVILTCTAGTPVEAKAVDQVFEIIRKTANETRLFSPKAPLKGVTGLGGSLARGNGFCKVYPNGDPTEAILPPSATDPNPVGACVAMWDNAGSSIGQEWDLEMVQLVADTFIEVGKQRPAGVNECHFGLFLKGGSAEFASGCWGKYDKTQHLSPEGKTTFSCPLGT